jgi:hypothetical protein
MEAVFAATSRVPGTGGYRLSTEPVEPLELVELRDPLGLHAEAEIELRLVRSLWPQNRMTGSTVEFSGIRLRNAALTR